MSCDYGRDELRAALLKSTVLLQAAASTARSPGEEQMFTKQAEENKIALKTEASTRPRISNPETCPRPDTP